MNTSLSPVVATTLALPPLVAILRGIQVHEVVAHAQVLFDVGFRAIEVPTNSPDWQKSVAQLRDHLPTSCWIGAGTVTTVAQLDSLMAAGGNLMVTPHCDVALLNHAKQIANSAGARPLAVLPGCMTVSEVFAAMAAGVAGVKLFPINCIGETFVRAIKSVIPPTFPLYAVGGVTPQNLGSYLSAGCVGAGLGSDLYRPGQAVADTQQKARSFVSAFAAWQAKN